MRRAVRTIILMLAAGMILIGGMFLGLELLKGRAHKGTPELWRCVAFGILTLAGGALIWKSSAITEHLTDDFDE